MAKILQFKKKSQKQVDRLVAEFLPSIRIISKRIKIRYPSQLEIDDLVSCGVIGLLQAIESYDPTRNILFKTYAEHRIRGSMLDEIRGFDWASRYFRDQIKAVKKMQEDMLSKNGVIDNQEIQKILKLDDYKFFEILKRLERSEIIHTSEDWLEGGIHHTSDEIPSNGIGQHISNLKDSEQQVLKYYYFEQNSMKEIAQKLKLSESRISQIHRKAIDQMREEIKHVA